MNDVIPDVAAARDERDKLVRELWLQETPYLALDAIASLAGVKKDTLRRIKKRLRLPDRDLRLLLNAPRLTPDEIRTRRRQYEIKSREKARQARAAARAAKANAPVKISAVVLPKVRRVAPKGSAQRPGETTDAMIARFIRQHGVQRCPVAASDRTTASIPAYDTAQLQEHHRRQDENHGTGNWRDRAKAKARGAVERDAALKGA